MHGRDGCGKKNVGNIRINSNFQKVNKTGILRPSDHGPRLSDMQRLSSQIISNKQDPKRRKVSTE